MPDPSRSSRSASLFRFGAWGRSPGKRSDHVSAGPATRAAKVLYGPPGMSVSRLIFVEQRPMAGRVLPIEAGLTIGREGTDIVLPDPEVSRKHAVIRVDEGGGAAIEDLGSTNGTYVNDERTDGAVAVDVGDVVRFGNTLWHVAAPGARTLVVGPRTDT